MKKKTNMKLHEWKSNVEIHMILCLLSLKKYDW